MLRGLFQPTTLLVILAIVLIVVGPKRLPGIGSAVGKSIREFRNGTRDSSEDLAGPVNEAKQPVDEITMHKMAVKPLVLAATTSAGEGGRICPKCSAGNASSSKFCGGCGAQIA